LVKSAKNDDLKITDAEKIEKKKWQDSSS